MKEAIAGIVAIILTGLISFGLVCLGVLFFAMQFGFDWSFLLCVCVWMCLIAARWVASGASNG